MIITQRHWPSYEVRVIRKSRIFGVGEWGWERGKDGRGGGQRGRGEIRVKQSIQNDKKQVTKNEIKDHE